MKAIYILSCVLLLFTTTSLFADDEVFTDIDVIFVESDINDPEYKDKPSKGHRLPSRKLECYINRQGLVEISTVDVEEILSFEIYDINGKCLGSFGDPESFTELLFSLDEPLEIRFITAGVMLRGCISR